MKTAALEALWSVVHLRATLPGTTLPTTLNLLIPTLRAAVPFRAPAELTLPREVATPGSVVLESTALTALRKARTVRSSALKAAALELALHTVALRAPRSDLATQTFHALLEPLTSFGVVPEPLLYCFFHARMSSGAVVLGFAAGLIAFLLLTLGTIAIYRAFAILDALGPPIVAPAAGLILSARSAARHTDNCDENPRVEHDPIS